MVTERQYARSGSKAEEGSGAIHKAQKNQNLLHLFTANGFQLTLAYPVDIFEVLNLLNRLFKAAILAASITKIPHVHL